jgi:formimidoylglutamate deiminase
MLSLHFAQALLPNGWAKDVRLTLVEGRIASVAFGPPEAGDERHAIGVPGLCNVHSHAFQRGMAGLSEQRGQADDDFWSWREVMYRFLDRLGPEDVEAIAAQAYVEMLETGFTRVGEFHYLLNDPDGRPYADRAELAGRIVAAAQTAGIGLTLLPVFYAHGDFGGAPPKPAQRRFVTSLDAFARMIEDCAALLSKDGALGIAPHSLRAVTPEELAHLIELRPAGPIHIHAAEQTKEVEDSVAALGARPVEWLLDNAPVSERWCLIHATQVSETECARLAASRAVAGLCPVTEANLGDGIFPAAPYLAANGRFGLGTDSNILIDAAAELRALEYSQRLQRRGRNLLANADQPHVGRTIFDAALAGGAQALGVESGLALGAPADVVSFDPDHPTIADRPGDLLLDGWIFAARVAPIDCVWRGGVRVVSSGRHHACEAVADRYRRSIRKLLQQ